MNTYQPRPIDTSTTELPRSLQPLMEQIAENTHEVWAAQRLKDGWSYGPRRDDASKLHPCLVPYEELPESEKQYDRVVAEQTLKLVVSLGYQIVPADR